MVFPIAGGTQDTGYEISNSLRFDDGDSPKLTFTPSSAVTSERKTFTISCWVKRGSNFGTNSFLWEMGGNDNANERIFCRFDSNNRLNVNDSSTAFRIPNRVFRDPSAWYHIVVAFDTTDSTADNRVKVYINGVQETSFLTSNNPGQNDTKGFSHNSEHTIARTGIDNNFSFDGYMTEFHAVGGSQLDATSFGEFNDNGVWIPKKYTGSHGTNGFYLEFKQTGTSANSSGIGADTSGNDNHLTPSNLASTDITTDTPQNNFAIYNAVDTSSNITLTEGNTVATANTNHSASRVTIGLRNGKWYWENKIVSDSGGPAVGIMAANAPLADQLNSTPSRFYRDSGQKFSDSSASSYGNTFTTNDIIGVALDLDNGAIYFYKNGTAENSGTAAFTDLLTATTEHWLPAVKLYNEAISINFGNPSHSISSGNADANGYGNFEYAPPSGYYAICTKNLAEFG